MNQKLSFASRRSSKLVSSEPISNIVSVREFWSDKTVLMTGVTGFVGKVLLEKYLSTIPRIGKIYLLIRDKPKQTLEDRLKKEIFSSQVFQPLFESRPELLDVVRERIVPVRGDLVQEGLGIEPEMRQRLIQELDVIINTAASISFNDPIREALQINYFGALRILDLAHECKHLAALHHVSTSYVNSNMPRGVSVSEEVHPFPEKNWEKLIDDITKMDPQTLDREEPLILKRTGFPNTYTMTKNLAEQALKKNRRPDMPLIVSRPAIITTTVKYPFPGWTDSLAAAGGVVQTIGLGVMRHIGGYKDVTSALVPCDYVVSAILVGTAIGAQKPELKLYHVCPSEIHPKIMQKDVFLQMPEYLKFQPWEIAVAPYTPLVWAKHRRDYLKGNKQDFLGYQMMMRFYSLPYIGNKDLVKYFGMRLKAGMKGMDQLMNMQYFQWHAEIHQTKRLLEMIPYLNSEEQELFDIDLRKMDNVMHAYHNIYGVGKYINNLDLLPPNDDLQQILQLNQLELGHDFKFALKYTQKLKKKDLKSFTEAVLNNQKFQSFLELCYGSSDGSSLLSSLQQVGGNSLQSNLIQLDPNSARQQLASMHATIERRAVTPILYSFGKIFRSLSQGLFVEQSGIRAIKSLMNQNERVVLVPTYKSFADFFILLFTLAYHGIELPFCVGNLEDTPHIRLVDSLLKGSGYIMARRSRDQSMQESYLTQAVIREILSTDKLLVMFQNDERMKSGRFTQPTVGDISIEWLMQAYYTQMVRENKNIFLVPVAINYDRLFEIRNLANEIVSNQNQQLSTATVLRMITQQREQSRGKLYMTFGKPINFERFLTDHSFAPLKPAQFDEATLVLTQHLILQQSLVSPVVLNMMVAALLLQTSSAKVNFDFIFKAVRQIYDYLVMRGGVKMIMRLPPSRRMVLDTIKKLGFPIKKVENRRAGKNLRGDYKINLDSKNDQKVLLGLSYYSNNLLHNLMLDASISKLIYKEMVQGGRKLYAISDMIKQTESLANLLRNEYLKRDPRGFPKTVEHRLQVLQDQKEIFQVQEDGVDSIKLNLEKQHVKSFSLVNFLHDLHSHIYDTYLVVLIALDELIQGNIVVKEKALIEQLHFAIIDMVNESLIPSLQSCVQVTIKTALHRFAAIGMIDLQTYRMENGSRITYISGQPKSLTSVKASQDEMIHLQSYSTTVIQDIGRIVHTAITQAMVTHLTSRL